MNQGKLEFVKQEMARVNINILGISELKWTGMSELLWAESLRRNEAALIVNKKSKMQFLGTISKITE